MSNNYKNISASALIKKVKKTKKEEEKKVETCSNCDDSGLVCSVCRAGYDVV